MGQQGYDPFESYFHPYESQTWMSLLKDQG